MLETKYTKNLIINHRELKYKGIFQSKDIFSTINRALEEKKYEKNEKKSEDLVTDQGRKTYVELRPYKEKSSINILMIKIMVTLNNITETAEEVNGRKIKYQQGDVTICFDAYELLDWEHHWMMKPFVYFMKGVINKYVYTWPLEASYKVELVNDTAYIYAQLRKLLNSYKLEVSRPLREDDIKRDVASEIKKEIEKEEQMGDKEE